MKEFLLFYNTLKLKSYIKNSSSKVLKAATRFPVVTLSAFLSFAFVLVYFHFYQYFQLPRRHWIFLCYESIVGISMFLAFALFSEKYKVDIGKRIGFALLGICILGLHFFALPDWAINLDATYFLRFFIFWFIFTLLVSFVIFYKEENKIAFWQYNQYLFIQFVVSTLFSLALFVGVATSLYAIEKLFELHIADAFYFDILAFFLLFVNTLFFSASLPNDFNWFKEPQPFRNPLRLFIKYVLLPILLIYYVILFIYLGKIVMSGILPEGWVALPILIFSSLGVLTYFLSYPLSYDIANSSIRFYVSYFFYFLLPLLTLLLAAVLTRVFEYGLTEYRYLGLLIGVWLVLVAFYTIIKKETSLVLFPISLFLLLFLGSVGPWGMYQSSARSQFLRLRKMLQHNELLENKVLSVEKLQLKITDSMAAEIGSINKYLFYREKIDLVYPILAEKEKKQIDSIGSSDNKIYAFNAFLKKTFSLPEKEQLPDFRRFNIYANNLDSFQLNIASYKSLQSFGFDRDNETLANILFMKGETLYFVEKDTFKFTIFPYLDSLIAYNFASNSFNEIPMDDYVNLATQTDRLSFESQDKKSKIVFSELAYRRNLDSLVVLENARFYFFR